MDEQEMEVALAVIKAVAPQLYKDGAQPWVKIVGDIGRIVGRPVRWVAELVDAVARRIPPEQLVTPPKALAAPLVEALPRVEDEPELRGMYEELLAKCMHAGHQAEVHPSFRTILDALSPDEARILAAFHPSHQDEAAYVRLTAYARKPKVTRDATVDTAVWVSFGRHDELLQPSALAAYRDNLMRLSIVADYSYTPRDGDVLERLEDETVSWASGHEANGFEVERSFSAQPLTEFGRRFVAACLPAELSSQLPQVQVFRVDRGSSL